MLYIFVIYMYEIFYVFYYIYEINFYVRIEVGIPIYFPCQCTSIHHSLMNEFIDELSQ